MFGTYFYHENSAEGNYIFGTMFNAGYQER